VPQNLELIESVGIEMEFSSIDRGDAKFLKELRKNLGNYKAIHDASCETPIDTFFGIPIDLETDESRETLGRFLQVKIIGGEIVSPIINSNSPQWVNDVRVLCELLQDFGEQEDTVRDSFHVHVNISRQVPLFVLKNLLHLCGHFELHLFKLGGMGRINRGEENHYIYQRPYLGFGPPCISQRVHDVTKTFPIMDFNDLLVSKDKTDFFRRYGDSNYQVDNGGRYVTQRYMSVNFYPILTQGSIEFRTANKTLNSDYIIAWTNLCKSLVEKAFSTRKLSKFFRKYNPLHANLELPEQYFLESLETLDILDITTIDILLDIWRNSPTPHFDNVARYSHLPNPTRYSHGNYYPKAIAKKHVEEADFIDVHQLQRDRPRNPRPALNLRREVAPMAIDPNFRIEVNWINFEEMVPGDDKEVEARDFLFYFWMNDDHEISMDWTRFDEDGEIRNDGSEFLGGIAEYELNAYMDILEAR